MVKAYTSPNVAVTVASGDSVKLRATVSVRVSVRPAGNVSDGSAVAVAAAPGLRVASPSSVSESVSALG